VAKVATTSLPVARVARVATTSLPVARVATTNLPVARVALVVNRVVREVASGATTSSPPVVAKVASAVTRAVWEVDKVVLVVTRVAWEVDKVALVVTKVVWAEAWVEDKVRAAPAASTVKVVAFPTATCRPVVANTAAARVAKAVNTSRSSRPNLKLRFTMMRTSERRESPCIYANVMI